MIFPIIEGFTDFTEIDLSDDSKGEYLRRFNAAENEIGRLKLEKIACNYRNSKGDNTVVFLKVFVSMKFLSTINSRILEKIVDTNAPLLWSYAKRIKED